MARLSLLALAAFVAVAHAAAPAPAAGDGGLPGTQFSVKELARGEGAPANCSFESGGQMGANWVEMTQARWGVPAGRRRPLALPLGPGRHETGLGTPPALSQPSQLT